MLSFHIYPAIFDFLIALLSSAISFFVSEALVICQTVIELQNCCNCVGNYSLFTII